MYVKLAFKLNSGITQLMSIVNYCTIKQVANYSRSCLLRFFCTDLSTYKQLVYPLITLTAKALYCKCYMSFLHCAHWKKVLG